MTDFDLEAEWELPYQQYREAGFRIMPLHPINPDGTCGCGNPDCEAAGKHPINSGWQHTPEWTDSQVATMREFAGQLYPALGIVIIVNHQLIVDVDPRNGGMESLARLEMRLGYKLRDKCKFIVKTGGEGWHYYFFTTEVLPKLRQSIKEYPGIDFKSSGYVVGWGSPHLSGMTYERDKGFPEDAAEPPADLVELLKAPERHTVTIGGESADVGIMELSELLSHIDPAGLDYQQWVSVGMGMHHATDGDLEACALWDGWSAKDSGRYNSGECDRKWHSFGKSTEVVRIGTLVQMARDGGYETPVTFTPDVDFDYTPDHRLTIEALAKNIQPWDMPGNAGKLYRWIDSQCRYPRATIAAGVTLYVLSAIGGMRHHDARDGMALNMMIFAVAASGSGKEALFQAAAELFSAVGITGAVHGKIKSEQEIYRNLIEHQLAAYSIDEIGIMLKKISQATESGGAAYMSGVIGALMEIYSKAKGLLTVTGDLSRGMVELLNQSAARVNKKLEGSNSDEEVAKLEAKLAEIQESIKEAQEGIRDPFLCMLGTTTPVTFDGTITAENAQNGFIARALILREHEDNPMWRQGFKKPPIPDDLILRLTSLYSGGNSEARTPGRVERQTDSVAITTTDEAGELLDEIQLYFWQQAESHKESTGFTGIYRRGWEMASKISLLLAMADGNERTKDHVVYGFAMAKRDVDTKAAYAYSQDERASNSIVVRLLSRLDEKVGKTRGEVNRILRGVKIDGGNDLFLEKLEQHGLIRSETVAPDGAGRPTIKYWKA